MNLPVRSKQFLALAGLTALETIRQPVCLLLMTLGVLFVTMIPVLLLHTLGDAQKLVRDSALAIHFSFGLILGGYAACATLTHEIRRGTVYAILSKPVSRELFYLAKYLGVALVMIFFSLAMTTATLFSTRASTEAYTLDITAAVAAPIAIFIAVAISGFLNFMIRKSFASTAFVLVVLLLCLAMIPIGFKDLDGNTAPFGQEMPWKTVPASALVTMAIMLLSAIAFALATRLDTVPTLTVTSLIFVLGLMSDYLFGRTADTSWIASLCYTVIPNWQHFWAADALTGDHTIPLTLMTQTGIYCLAYLGGILCLGMFAFRQLEIRV